MIDLYFAPTPNGWKASVMLEECELDYKVINVDIGKGEQFEPDFLALSPNNRIPAIVDNSPDEGEQPISVFETGAILLYLAKKTDKFLSSSLQEYKSALEWLFWQVGGLGPMMGQHGHFKLYAPERIEYPTQRYQRETLRLFGVLNSRLAEVPYLAGNNYSVADIATFPWVQTYKAQGIDLPSFEHIFRWYEQLKQRPALRRGMAIGRESLNNNVRNDSEARKILFGVEAE